MYAVVIEREADQQRVHAKPRAERLDDWNGSAAADDGRLLTPFLLERLRSRLEDGSRRVEADRGRASFAGVSGGAIGRKPLGDEAMQAIEDGIGGDARDGQELKQPIERPLPPGGEVIEHARKFGVRCKRLTHGRTSGFASGTEARLRSMAKGTTGGQGRFACPMWGDYSASCTLTA